MLSISDIITNLLLKKGVIGEVRNFETNVDLPQGSDKEPIKIVIKADHLQVRLDNSNKQEGGGGSGNSMCNKNSYTYDGTGGKGGNTK